jgi:glucose/arabinose dehydrogenase
MSTSHQTQITRKSPAIFKLFIAKLCVAASTILYYGVSALCAQTAEVKETTTPTPDTSATRDGATHFQVETVASGLEVPWAMAFAPDGRLFVTERPGRLRVIQNGQLRAEPLAVIAEVESSRETGLMGLALHPRFAVNRWLYLAYAYQDKGRFVRVERFRVQRSGETGDALTERKVIIDKIPAAGLSRRLPHQVRAGRQVVCHDGRCHRSLSSLSAGYAARQNPAPERRRQHSRR